LKQNRAADALAVYDNISLTRARLRLQRSPSMPRPGANGKMEDAKSEAEQIRAEQLLSEERQLIADLQRE